MNNEENKDENFYRCLYCEAVFDTEEERDAHTFEKHMDTVEQKLSEITEKLSKVAEDHKEVIYNWKNQKRKEFLLQIASENPRLLHEIQTSPHADEMLDKMVEEDIFKRALRTETLSSFDAMWLKHPKFEEVYQASRSKPKHEPKTGDSTGQSEEFFESPDAMIDSTQRTNKREDLSDEDKQKQKALLILTSLLRKRKA